MRTIAAITTAAILAVPGFTQEMPKSGPEHALLKKREGTWTTVMKSGGMEYKGTVTLKMDLGGFWLTGVMESELFGQKFTAGSLDGYDPAKKKYVGVWVDSMSAAPVIMAGTYDKKKDTLTLAGEGPGMDGKPAKFRSLTTMPDAKTMVLTMYIGDGKDPAFVVTYKRKK